MLAAIILPRLGREKSVNKTLYSTLPIYIKISTIIKAANKKGYLRFKKTIKKKKSAIRVANICIPAARR